MDVPEWSGEFVQLNEGVYMMCLSLDDERTIPTPPGLALAATTETCGGDVTVYVYVREEAMAANF